VVVATPVTRTPCAGCYLNFKSDRRLLNNSAWRSGVA
jgi:hypothetical protein